MPDEPGHSDELNWVDPDIVAYYEASGGDVPTFEEDLERPFKQFFKHEWPKPKYDYLRETWDPLIHGESPHMRVMGKTALWAIVGNEFLKELELRSSGTVET